MKLSILIFFVTIIFSQNTYPIILIHGFLGWGREEMAGYYYWGGKMDYESKLRSLGFEVFTVSVGPISTNWDRAIEAFYQIKGGQVNYGNTKSKKLKRIQKPKNKIYNGLYPIWDAQHPVHIIAHSQGGQTAKVLEQLLKTIYKNESDPLLSVRNKGWIKSITTISTPHNGSSLVPMMTNAFPFALKLAPWFGSIDNKFVENFYNFDLEQWGLIKLENETLNNFINRLSTSPLANPENQCSWELSPKGASEFNKNYFLDDKVYYFSFTTYATRQKKDSKYHKPDSSMSIHLWPTALLMGSDKNVIDSSWYENDGIVNSISMSNPTGSQVIQYNNNPQTGVWQSMERLNHDHQAIIGHGISKKMNLSIFALYNQHCNLLYELK